MIIRIEGHNLPGLTFDPGRKHRDSEHHNLHVAVQGRKGQQDLFGLLPGDAAKAVWELECALASAPPLVDLKGPQIQGASGNRFIYITWGAIDTADRFTMVRRAKLWLADVPSDVMEAACTGGMLVGSLRLSDDEGGPICASVRPPRIRWSATGLSQAGVYRLAFKG